MVNLSRKELINEPTGTGGIRRDFDLLFFDSLTGRSSGRCQNTSFAFFHTYFIDKTGCKVQSPQSPYMSKALQNFFFSVFWFAVSPNHIKLTVDSKMAREAHVAWGATGGRAHC